MCGNQAIWGSSCSCYLKSPQPWINWIVITQIKSSWILLWTPWWMKVIMRLDLKMTLRLVSMTVAACWTFCQVKVKTARCHRFRGSAKYITTIGQNWIVFWIIFSENVLCLGTFAHHLPKEESYTVGSIEGKGVKGKHTQNKGQREKRKWAEGNAIQRKVSPYRASRICLV